MLTELHVQNFALIDRLEIDLHPGFSVLTGETGAGKTIIIDALGVALGEQGLAEFIRSGEDKALVEAVFEVKENKKICGLMTQYGFPADQPLILARELVKTGKNICRINGKQVNLSVFKDFAEFLVDIYGQHHQQSLLDPQKHIELLDEYGGQDLISLKQELAAVYEELASLQARLKVMETGQKEQARMADVYRFQVTEIEQSKLIPGEDAALEAEKKVLANAEKLYVLTSEVYELLYEGNGRKAATDLLSAAIHQLKEASAIDATIRPVWQFLESSLYQIEEAARELRVYTGKIEADPDRLAQVEARLDLLRQLKRKYGDSLEEILNYREQAAASLALLTNYDEELAKTKNALAQAETEYTGLAGRLSSAREKTAAALTGQITGELKELSMPHVTFAVRLSQKAVPTGQGVDEVEFLISPNQGEPLKPLAKIVSGGEVARIMLAFKTILAKVDAIPTLIFDEVDAGIGGQALQAVARKLSLIGRSRQVICVTHSPRIAGWADNHYAITKSVIKDRTVTRLKELSVPERVDEIARMLAGGKVTPVSKKHAEEILEQRELF